MFRVDLHVHTGRYSQCAEFVDPYQIAATAVKAQLSGVVITEHDILWEEEETELLKRSSAGIRLYRGIEVSASGCHLLVIGIDDAGALHRDISMAEVVAYAHRYQAAVILAHPYRDDADPECLPVQLVDAVEVGSTSFSAEEARRSVQLAQRFGKPVVAGSDAHALSRIGWAWTNLPALPANETELAAAIRSGLGRPVTPYPFPS